MMRAQRANMIVDEPAGAASKRLKAIRLQALGEVKAEFLTEWKRYAEIRDTRLREAAILDADLRQAIRQLSRPGADQAKAAHPVREDRDPGVINLVQELKTRRAVYLAQLDSELRAFRCSIMKRQNERVAEVVRARLKHDRTT